MRQAELSNEPVLGIKGICSLIKLPSFNFESSLPVDFMHSVCLGTVKYIVDIWLNSKNNRQEFYLGLKIKQIDIRLMNIRPYSEISRYPREITQRHQWKANEWLNFLLYFSNPSLLGLLPEIYFKNFQLLRKSIRILLGNNLNEKQLQKCQKIIQKFVRTFQDLYGEKYMVYNIHLLFHLVDSVRNFGPLWNFSLYPYENLNGCLKSYVKGPKEPLIQINSKYLLKHDLYFNKYTDTCREDVIKYCNVMMKSGITKLMTPSECIL